MCSTKCSSEEIDYLLLTIKFVEVLLYSKATKNSNICLCEMLDLSSMFYFLMPEGLPNSLQ